MEKIILHIDMNSYFASVEQQANPFLRGRAVGVCSYLSPNGCIIASSVEAKAKGIKTGCRVSEAKRLDPRVVLIENEPAKYRAVTEKFFAILGTYSGTVEPYSIDEAFVDLSGWVKDFIEAEILAKEIQKRIKAEVGEWLNCSIGLSFTKFLAKFAGDIAPKKGILLIRNIVELETVLKDRPLQDAWGINNRMEERLNLLGIKSLFDLKNFNPDNIRRVLGRYGYYLWANVNGIEVSAVSEGSPAPKSIGHSYCLPKKTTDKKYLSGILYKLCEKTGRRLRLSNLEARSIQVGFAYAREGRLPPHSFSEGGLAPHSFNEGGLAPHSFSEGGCFQSFKTKESLFTTEEIFSQANRFLEKSVLLMAIRMLAVSVGTLAPVSGQLSFFEDRTSKKELSRAMDKLNDKYGEYTVVRGQMFGTGDMARDRIGFRKLY